MFGNDLATFPNFPAEIRAPQGTLAGVSSFQLHFADHDILTPGDRPDVLVAMNPAALKANIADVPKGAILIVDTHDFTDRALARVGWASNPLEDGTLDGYTRARDRPDPADVGRAGGQRAVAQGRRPLARTCSRWGCCRWMYSRPTEATLNFLRSKFAIKPDIAEANIDRVQGGLELRRDDRVVRGALRDQARAAADGHLPQHHRQHRAGLRADRGRRSARGCRCSSAPTRSRRRPTSCTSCRKHKRFGVRTFQAEDEIAGIGAALGAAFGGALAVTTSSGPGIALKGETIGLAVSLELPLIICDIQRGGPSTGLPTKTEQSDLLQAMYGRNGEAPVPIVAAQSPGDCFDAAIEAARIALTYRTPVFLLSDGYLANGSEPWRVPSVADLPDLSRRRSRPNPTATTASSCPTCATPRRWPGRGRCPAPRVWSTASAASRRPTRPATSATTRTTTTSWSAPARPRSTGIARIAAAAGGRRPGRRRAGAGARLGLDVRPDRRGLPTGARRRRVHRPGAPAPPQPVPGRPRRDPGPLRQGRHPRDEPRPARRR